MRVFKNKWFARFARKERIADVDLCDAVSRAERGLIDAELGGGLIKQRVARPGAGKSGGYRTIIVYKTGARVFFIYGFAKNERENITGEEVRAFKEAAASYLSLGNDTMAGLVDDQRLIEVICNA